MAAKIAKDFLGKGNVYLRKILNDNDSITDIASSLMRADTNFDESRGTTLGTLRYTYAKNTILNIIKYIKENREICVSNFELTPERRYDKSFKNEGEHLRAAKDILSDREFGIIEDHFYNGQTFEDIGEKQEVSRQRVHQIFNKAIDKLRNHVEDFK